MSNLVKRILTALIAGVVAISAIWYSWAGMVLFCTVVSLAGIYEFYKMTLSDKKVLPWVNIAGVFIFWICIVFGKFQELRIMPYLLVFGFLLIPMNAIILLFKKDHAKPADILGRLMLGWAYTVLPLILLFFVAFLPPSREIGLTERILEMEYDPRMPLGLLVLIWSTDTFAYFGGRTLGKRKLMERVSPKKTWEGSISGALGCFLIAFGMNHFWGEVGWNWFVVAGIVSVFSQIGDLVESMMKRSAEVKDSGSILPGHGGMMDRFDGLYLTAPLVWVYVMILYTF